MKESPEQIPLFTHTAILCHCQFTGPCTNYYAEKKQGLDSRWEEDGDYAEENVAAAHCELESWELRIRDSSSVSAIKEASERRRRLLPARPLEEVNLHMTEFSDDDGAILAWGKRVTRRYRLYNLHRLGCLFPFFHFHGTMSTRLLFKWEISIHLTDCSSSIPLERTCQDWS